MITDYVGALICGCWCVWIMARSEMPVTFPFIVTLIIDWFGFWYRIMGTGWLTNQHHYICSIPVINQPLGVTNPSISLFLLPVSIVTSFYRTLLKISWIVVIAIVKGNREEAIEQWTDNDDWMSVKGGHPGRYNNSVAVSEWKVGKIAIINGRLLALFLRAFPAIMGCHGLSLLGRIPTFSAHSAGRRSSFSVTLHLYLSLG